MGRMCFRRFWAGKDVLSSIGLKKGVYRRLWAGKEVNFGRFWKGEVLGGFGRERRDFRWFWAVRKCFKWF